jgi:hypothetical protein
MVTSTPIPEFEESTGYIILRKGKQRQVICRVSEEGHLLFLWRRTKEEVPVTIEDLAEIVYAR